MERFCFNIFFIIFLFYAHAVAASDRSKELLLLTWSEYTSPEVVSAFEKQFNVKVNFQYYETDHDRTSILVNSNGRGFDLLLINSIDAPIYQKNAWLAELNLKQMHNIKHVNQRWRDKCGPFSVPYFWGTMGIVYRTKDVKQPIDSWMDLFEPEDSLKNKIVMVRDQRDLLGAALKALGFSFNSNDRDQLQQAEELLRRQKPFVKEYSYPMLSKDSALISGKVVAAMLYSGDVYLLREQYDHLTYVVPVEGTVLWTDCLAVAQHSKQKELAMQFINFINSPDMAAIQAQFVSYATPNKAAEKLLPKAFLADPVIYPLKALIDLSEEYMKLSPEALRQRNAIYVAITQ